MKIIVSVFMKQRDSVKRISALFAAALRGGAMENNMKKYRHELKYLISYGEMEALKLRMKSYFKIDPNASDGEYTIRSLYFDDMYNSAYEDKECGVFFRTKYRIRIYNHSSRSIKLERKIKQGSYIYKESADLTRDEVYKILDGDFEFLLYHRENLCREFYIECVSKFMRPRVIVDYEREPYILDAGTLRITFDKRVRAAIGGYDIFDDSLPTLPSMTYDKVIMEVKFTEFLPGMVRDMMPAPAAEFTAASKYVLCCDKTKYLNGCEYYIDERNAL